MTAASGAALRKRGAPAARCALSICIAIVVVGRERRVVVRLASCPAKVVSRAGVRPRPVALAANVAEADPVPSTPAPNQKCMVGGRMLGSVRLPAGVVSPCQRHSTNRTCLCTHEVGRDYYIIEWQRRAQASQASAADAMHGDPSHALAAEALPHGRLLRQAVEAGKCPARADGLARCARILPGLEIWEVPERLAPR